MKLGLLSFLVNRHPSPLFPSAKKQVLIPYPISALLVPTSLRQRGISVSGAWANGTESAKDTKGNDTPSSTESSSSSFDIVENAPERPKKVTLESVSDDTESDAWAKSRQDNSEWHNDSDWVIDTTSERRRNKSDWTSDTRAKSRRDDSNWVIETRTSKERAKRHVDEDKINDSVKVDNWTGKIRLGSQWQVPESRGAAHKEAGPVRGVASVWSRHSSNDDWAMPASNEDGDDDDFVVIREDPGQAELTMSGGRQPTSQATWW